jgi:hypothetical protein
VLALRRCPAAAGRDRELIAIAERLAAAGAAP